jgi:alkylation response protein AidB-like acyl-CoA dehydrogenase
MDDNAHIASPQDSRLDELVDQLAEVAPELDLPDAWPAHQLALCGKYGVYRWFVPKAHGGLEWDDADIIRGYLRLSAACLTTTFVITQRMGACRRIAMNEQNEPIKRMVLPDLVSGQRFATVGISHLTTSRRHLARPALRAEPTEDGFVLDGQSPWVTGSPYADLVVMGATLDDGRQILVALPTDLPGVEIADPLRLIGLSASQTGPVLCHRVHVSNEYLLAGPTENVMQQGVGAKSGGLQTSTLAAGLAGAAIKFLETESQQRSEIAEPSEALRSQWQRLCDALLATAAAEPVCSNEELRRRANDLALRATQASLAAAKGAGYVTGHPAGRWAREALFFLVWSCPQSVLNASLCELAELA